MIPPDTALVRQTQARGLSLPLDILVATPNARRPSKLIKPHVFSGSLPDNSFVDIGDGLFVSSPELSYFQMANELSFIKLIELGFELCGSYSRPAHNSGEKYRYDREDKCVYNLPKLTNFKKLSVFTQRMKSINGYIRAKKALPYIADGSGSPMETVLVMLLTMPYRYGGYGLPMPRLNSPVVPIKSARQLSNKDYFKCDLFWHDYLLAAEYDSEEYHNNPYRMAEDAKRRNTLASLGIFPVTVTKQQIFNISDFEMIAMQLASGLNKRLKHKKPGFVEAQRELRVLLLP